MELFATLLLALTLLALLTMLSHDLRAGHPRHMPRSRFEDPDFRPPAHLLD